MPSTFDVLKTTRHSSHFSVNNVTVLESQGFLGKDSQRKQHFARSPISIHAYSIKN